MAKSTIHERWLPVPGYPGYLVSSLGKIIGPKGYTLNGTHDSAYPRVLLYTSATKHVRIGIHQVVALTFIGPAPEGMELNHKDGNKLNPALDNLEYVTRSDNAKHSYASGFQKPKRGITHVSAKLNDEKVRAIRAATGASSNALARQYGVSRALIHKIWQRRTWAHVS